MPKEQQSELKQDLGMTLINQCIGTRQRRRTVEEQWLNNHRMWMNTEFQRIFQSSDSDPNNYNIPAGRRAIERTAIRAVQLLTPNVKWFETMPLGDMSEQKLSNVDSFMSYVLRKKIRSRSNIGLLARCMVMYGRCHIKTSVTVRNKQVWPTQRVVDPFSLYIFPETASTFDEADVLFEDFLISWDKYNAIAKNGNIEPINKNDLGKPDWPYHLTERLSYQGITDPTAAVDGVDVKDKLNDMSLGYVSLTERWLQKDDQLFQVYIVNNMKHGPQVVGFFESEYDEPLYRGVVHRPLPNETYTNSMASDITTLDSLQNDMINMFTSAVDWEQGFVAFDNSVLGGQRKDSFKMKGRAKWEMGTSPKDMLQLITPPDTSSNILRAWQILYGMEQSLGGTGTITEGQPGRNMPRSGQAVGQLINLSMADVTDLAELIEQEVLTPSLSDIYKVSVQFIPDDQLMRIPGGQGLFDGKKVSTVLRKDAISGDYEFEWVGSLQFQDEEQRSQRLMVFLNLMPQLAPILQSQGYAPNMPELIKMIWRYGLGERGLADVIVPLQQLQQQLQKDQAVQNGVPDNNGAMNGQTNGVPPTEPYKGLTGLSVPPTTSGFTR